MRHRIPLATERLRALISLLPWSALINALVTIVELAGAPHAGKLRYRDGLLFCIEVVALGLLGASPLLRYWLLKPRSLRELTYAQWGLRSGAFLLGCLWATMPLVMFPSAPANERVVVACVCAGLIATSIAFAPINGMTEAMAVPLALTCGIELLQQHSPPLDWLVAALAFYVVFVLMVSQRFYRMLGSFLIAELELKTQQETLQLVTGRMDGSKFAGVWETDATGNISFIVPELLQKFSIPSQQAAGHFLAFLQQPPLGILPDDAFAQLQRCLQGSIAFRSLVLTFQNAGQTSHWSFSGAPMFGTGRVFIGFRGMASDVTDETIAQRRASQLARQDALTLLPNRVAFMDLLRTSLTELGRAGTQFAILSIDLDGFKAVNDRLGHAAGDAVLRVAARRIMDAAGPKVTVARFGGDEFLALVTTDDLALVEATAIRILSTFSRPLSLAGRLDSENIWIGASIGIALAPLSGDSADILLEAADLAMYRAKEEGGNTWRHFHNQFREQMEQRRAMIQNLRHAIEHQEITLAFQPVVDANTLQLRGVEALARWYRPQMGWVPPERFIRLAEEAGLIEKLGAQLLEKACRAAMHLPPHLTIAVNVSVGQFVYAPGFVAAVREIVQRTNIDPTRLELEITESIFMDADGANVGVLRALADTGVRLVLDDFGRGFSSIGFLKEFRFDKIKIDSGFVQDMIHDRRSAAIVQAVIVLAAGLGVVMTAEGVETEEQLEMLRRYGCRLVQGYLFSPPIHEADLPELAQFRENEFGSPKTNQAHIK